MATTVYTINKGINRPVVFKGLKAQYIVYVAIGVLSLLVLFAVLYIIGTNMFLCIAIVAILGVLLFVMVYRISDKYGQYGLMKRRAYGRIPHTVRLPSRWVFLSLGKTKQ
ncbi:DUF4133 domain-containing protein [Pseudochryseolinea flava]|uniref:DUF4133 domain-containing protein n=1 Tax=Pseudochryseolinea flava TaxID=2059302 RepID=A0A364XXX7_9BACT|nr:DUF4133 domain-containing protein [Pseudochryseolinea flava]RAV98849.1 hypothetical protein DQQ10_21330 [Pseudochryseolinea flava]